MAAAQVFVRDGKAYLRDAAGQLTTHDPAKARDRILSGKYAPASAEEVQARDAERAAASTSGLAAMGEAAVASAYDAAVAPATIPAALLSKAAGTQDPTAPLSGREIMRELAYLGGEAVKGEGRDTAAQYEAESRERATAHPVLSAIGTIGGSVAGGLGLSGGARAAGAKAAAATGSKLLGSTAAGALEGAALGGAAAREEAYLKDEALTAESVLAGMGWGALIGGGVGLAVGGGQRLFGRAGSRGATPLDSPRLGAGTAQVPSEVAEKGGLRGWLREFAEERTTKALGARGTDIRKLGRTAPKAEAEMRRMARDVLEHKLDDGTPVFRAVQSQDDLVERVARAQQETGAKLSALRKEVGQFIQTKADDLTPDAIAIANRIDQEVAKPLLMSVVPDVQAQAQPVQRMSQAIRSLAFGPKSAANENAADALALLTKARQDIDSIIYPKATGPGLPPLPPAHKDQLIKVRAIIEEEIEAATDKAVARMDPARMSEYQTLKGKWRSFREASQIAGKAQLQDLGNRVVSPSDYITGAAVMAGDMATGGGLSLVKAGAAAAAHKAVREHSSAMLAVLADRMARNVDAKLGRGVSGFFKRSFAALDTPKGLPTPTRALPSRGATPTALEVFRGKEASDVVAYRKKTAQLDQAVSNFGAGVRERTQQALGDELPQRAPKLAGAIASSATRGALFLQSKRPNPPTNLNSLTPHASAPVPSDYELAKFARYWNTVANPMSAVRDLENGTLTHEQVEALAVVYPRLYRRIQEHVMTKLREADAKGIEVPYQAKLQLDLLLNLNGAGEPTATPDFMLRFAQMQAQVAQQQAAAPRPQPVKLSDRYATKNQALEKGM